MTCEDCEEKLLEELGGEPEAPGVADHLASCEKCRAAANESREALQLAALPPPTAGDRAAMAMLPQMTLSAWRGEHRRRGVVGRVAQLAIAAGIGALVATGVLMARPRAAAPSSADLPDIAISDLGYEPADDSTVAEAEPNADEFDLSSLEVSWTGDAPTDVDEAPTGDAP